MSGALDAARGASPAVTRAVTGQERRNVTEVAPCPRCGAAIDFARRDPLGLGRTMQGCSNPQCPDHRSRPMTVRHP